jgi:hypothetical protein
MANALSAAMTVRDFENGYWYLDQLKNFAGRIGISAAKKAAERRTRKGYRGIPAHGQGCVATKRSLRKTASRTLSVASP